MSSPASAVNVHNQAGRDNVITQSQTIINDRSVWFLMFMSIFWILRISIKRKVAKRLEDLKKILRPRMIENTSYNDQKKRPCETGTRNDVLKEIVSWIKDVSKDSQCFYWLSGEPGVGKSAITTSIVKYCIDRNILGAQFFINRDDTTTTNPAVLFPSICWQLCNHYQQVAIVMEKILRARPTLVDDISFDQASKLFVKAIYTAAAINRSRPIVIVIDALDETDTKRVGHLAQILSKVVTNLPQNAKVFISSRTEEPITKSFNSLRDLKQVKSRHLAAKDSRDEVSRFMEGKIKEILLEYSMTWEDFADDSRRISSQASGLYIWAETALKFLRAEIKDKGTACFGGLLSKLAAKGMNDINTLYLTILQNTCKNEDWERQRFRRIVGAIVVRQSPLSIADMTELLDLQEPDYSKPVDVVHFVRQYRTVLVTDTVEINDRVVPRMHKSFADFITSEGAQEFRVDVRASHGELALQCMNKLDKMYAHLDSRLGPERPSFPSQLVYATRNWHLHLTRMVEPNMNNEAGVKEKYDMPDIPQDAQSLPANPRDVTNLKPGTEEIEGEEWSSRLTLAFSPDGTRFALAHGYDIHIRDARTGSVTKSLVGHRGGVWSVGFSPDGTQLVSASIDRTVRIWDVQTGTELHVLRGHTHGVFHAAFSHDGRMLVTWDETVRTWNSSTGQQLNVFRGHTSMVIFCTFSPDDERIASCSWNEIIVWDVNSGNLISKLDSYHEGCLMILFCPCGNHLMSCNGDGEIKLWDAELGKQLDHANSIDARLAFVDDSEQESASTYIHVPALQQSGSSTLHMYTLKTKYGDVRSMVERDQAEGVWELVPRLYVVAGVTRLIYRLY